MPTDGASLGAPLAMASVPALMFVAPVYVFAPDSVHVPAPALVKVPEPVAMIPLTIAVVIIIVGLLGLAMRTLPVGTAYAVWTGIGAVGTVLLGIVLFGEPATLARLACVGLILVGIVGLKLSA